MRILSFLVLCIVILSSDSGLHAQSLNGYWDSRFAPCGVDWPVEAVAIDGNKLYVTGQLDDNGRSGGKRLRQPVLWDGVTWSSVGGGVFRDSTPYSYHSTEIRQIVLSGNDIFVSGYFDHAGGQKIRDIARWNSVDGLWHPLGNGLSDDGYTMPPVSGMAADSNYLYISGADIQISGAGTCSIARWDRKNDKWEVMVNHSSQIGCQLLLKNGMLYAYGDFSSLDGFAAYGIARWNIQAGRWEKVENQHAQVGLNQYGITSVKAGRGDTLYAVGNFAVWDNLADTIIGNNLLRWDGRTWSAYGISKRTSITFPADEFPILSGDSTHLNITGDFEIVQDTEHIRYFAAFDGSKWKRRLPESYWDPHNSLLCFDADSTPYISYYLSEMNFGRWNGTNVVPVDSGASHGIQGTVKALLLDNDTMYVAGDFLFAGGVRVNHVAKWSGSEWLPLGANLSEYKLTPVALAKYNGELYIGNDTQTDSTSFLRLRNGKWSAPLVSGVSMDGQIWSLAKYKNMLVVGGEYTTINQDTFNGIALWDGSKFQHLGSGFGPFASADHFTPLVAALLPKDSSLYAGGGFGSADGKPAYCVARWDGNAWSALDDDPRMSPGDTEYYKFTVYSLCSRADTIFIGGDFDYENRGLAIFDGKHFQQVTDTIPQPPGVGMYVNAMETGSDKLYLAGGLDVLGMSILTPQPACLQNGNRFSLGKGIPYSYESDAINSMKLTGKNELVVVGAFSDAGGIPSQGIAIWHEGSNSVSARQIGNGELSIYPNPASASITIASSLPLLHVSITDMLGNEIASLSSSTGELNWSTLALPNGIYTCIVQNGAKRLERKFVVLK
ncbi:MAG: T9SS type A sorting domain-containing protein [Bacteroidota bacterium]|nr:T9SS type A sorting domain-containing protein [Bacteroidota bacterium]